MIEWNEVIYADCMNEENGLPTLEDKSIDLCLTDPPYGIDFQTRYEYNKQEYYDDKYKGFNWNIKWFKEILRICNGIIFTPGMKNLYDWIIYKKPNYELKFWYKSNDANHRTIEPFLLYGKIKNISHLGMSISRPQKKQGDYIHPTIKNIKVWEYFIKKLKPISVIDPFIGSGTTAEVCTKLGIPWLGYELNEVYSQDINKRLNGCVKEPQQVGLMGYMNGGNND